jgi:tetratricopeptide (TPR) repeat protein
MINSYPNDTDTFYRRGVLKAKIKDFKGAIADYTKVISINPDYKGVYIFRGAARIDIGDFTGAIDDLTIAIKKNPFNKWSYLYRGISKMGLFNTTGALSDIDHALSLDRKFKVAFCTREILLVAIRENEIGLQKLFINQCKTN